MAQQHDDELPILHIIVVGFHHKKGCQVGGFPDLHLQLAIGQLPIHYFIKAAARNTYLYVYNLFNFPIFVWWVQVEFSYPPLVANSDESTACPSGWKYLPTLGLPDGSHNFVQDSVFFNLPSLTDPNETIFGVSCYRQISVDVREDLLRQIWCAAVVYILNLCFVFIEKF